MKIAYTALTALLALAALPQSAERLVLQGKQIQYQGQPIYLHGANTIAQVGKISESDAQNFKEMGMNFVRLLIDIDTELDLNDTEGDGDYIKQSALVNWQTVTKWFTDRQIWVNLEVRSNDYDLDTSALWVVGSPLHSKFTQFWKKMAKTFGNSDYIAAYGLLAEHGQGKIKNMKAAFLPIMQAIDSVDGKTPFTFGPKLNSIDYYDFAKYPDYYWPEYANRIIYQINHLHPKPFINKDPAKGYDPATWWYHRTDGQNGAGADNDGSMNKAGTLAHLNPGFLWRDHYDAPIYIDQWGCDFTQPGYMDYERDMLEIFAENGSIANTRWTYYMSGARGIMNDYNGSWVLHQPLYDFFKASSAGLIWPHEVAVSHANAADNHVTTQAVSAGLPWTIDFKFSAPFASDKIELWSGNGSASEDPQDVEIYGSSDSLNWHLLGNIKGVQWNSRQAQYTSPAFANSTAYLYYRAKITANHGGAQTAISNLEFFPSAVSGGQVALRPMVNVVPLVYDALHHQLWVAAESNARFDLEVLTAQGAKVLAYTNRNFDKGFVNLEHLPTGIYIARFRGVQGIFDFKIRKD